MAFLCFALLLIISASLNCVVTPHTRWQIHSYHTISWLQSRDRRIPKFNVQRTEYRITIPAIQQNDIPFNIVSAMVHNVFARE